MKTFSASREDITKVLRSLTILAATGLLTGLLSSCATAPQPGATTTSTPTPETQMSEEARRKQEWHLSMAQTPFPKKIGCFQASYPNKEWHEVACVKAPPYPMVPKRGPRPFIVGNTNDVSAQAPSGLISMGIGTFDSVSAGTTETGQINGAGPQVANAYSLQVNTNFFFGSTGCSGAAVPAACQGWEQFVFANDGTSGFAFIQYWVISYNTPCAAGWFTYNNYPNPGDISCYRNSTNNSGTPNEPISNLINLILSGTANAGSDRYDFSDGAGTMVGAAGDDSVGASAGWSSAEFIVCGDAGGGQANFSAGTTIVPRARIIYGGTAPPNCLGTATTGETNNLSFGPTAPAASGPGPALFSTQSIAGGAMSNCAAATAVGDTHLQTFGGLAYDFQASGDFLLAQVDPDFVVQTRQVSGAPTWPDASVNSAVATQMGNNKVAICLAPTRLNLNGENKDLADGSSVSTPDGVDVTRKGNIYFISDKSGNSVRATVNSSPDYIDVSVGLGRWPAKVTGLLANANGNVNQVAARDGTVLTTDFPFDEFYNHYGESWRVSPRESLLSACGAKGSESGNPRRPFYAKDLEPNVRQHALAVCTAAGVKPGALLDDCTLDVAVIGNDNAAKVFVNARQPTAVGLIVETSGGKASRLLLKWWWLWLLLLLIVVIFILWIIRRGKNP